MLIENVHRYPPPTPVRITDTEPPSGPTFTYLNFVCRIQVGSDNTSRRDKNRTKNFRGTPDNPLTRSSNYRFGKSLGANFHLSKFRQGWITQVGETKIERKTFGEHQITL
ncbi:hypothetical protein CDAR_373021 [Caerostris darwini]|uniref:Ribosomal protein L2 n=1 Tax=Caerostris darwini TaxID=1538125 RepID=A0AAV4SW04_9ARAC|nr:hypothetical protein CDAR_373021 [Caerostris darwini]